MSPSSFTIGDCLLLDAKYLSETQHCHGPKRSQLGTISMPQLHIMGVLEENFQTVGQISVEDHLVKKPRFESRHCDDAIKVLLTASTSAKRFLLLLFLLLLGNLV